MLRIAFALVLLLPTLAYPSQPVDRIVAVVEKEPIFVSDVESALNEELYLRRMRGEEIPEDSLSLEALRSGVLDDLINRRIVIAKAKKEGIEVTRTEVEDALEKWISDLIRAAGSEEAFREELKREGMTVRDLKDYYRDDIEDQLIVSKFMRKQFSGIQVTEEEIRRFFESKYDSIPEIPAVVGLSHILIIPKVPPEREEQVYSKASECIERIRGGEPFSEVAREFSDDRLTRDSGGEIGLVALEDLGEEIKQAVSQLGIGDVSEPIRTKYGLEIIKLDTIVNGRYKLSHIFLELHTTHQDTVRASRLAHEIRDRILAGESFESLAKTYSDDERTKDSGGYLGEVEISALGEPHHSIVKNLNPGEISDVVLSDFGFQIIKVVSRSATRKPSFEEAKDWIRSVIEARKRESEFKKWLEETKKEIYVKVYE